MMFFAAEGGGDEEHLIRVFRVELVIALVMRLTGGSRLSSKPFEWLGLPRFPVPFRPPRDEQKGKY